MAKLETTDLIAADRLVGIIQRMADRQTNPVLEVLGDQIHHLQQEQKYPQPPLDFQQGPWRAFYHCHAVADNYVQEHGHFHIFLQCQQGWTHVAGLSMDTEGQPQSWLAVNRWVTDGPWLPATELIQLLKTAAFTLNRLSIVETWLLAMLQVFADEVASLLEARDSTLRQINKNTSDSVLLNNRDIYTLATHEIDLLAKLTSLYPEPQTGEIK